MVTYMKDVLWYRKWLWANGYLFAGTQKVSECPGAPEDLPVLMEQQTITGLGWALYYLRRGLILCDIFAPDPDRRF